VLLLQHTCYNKCVRFKHLSLKIFLKKKQVCIQSIIFCVKKINLYFFVAETMCIRKRTWKWKLLLLREHEQSKQPRICEYVIEE